MNPQTGPLLALQGVRKVFPTAAGELVVLDDVHLTVQSGEIVGLLGRSGSGKSTLLRAIAGLMPLTAGRILYRGTPVTGPSPGIAMMFQSFALFPWLTVLGNVKLGLQALGVPAHEASRRSLAAIDLIGLDGFETAYPRELSGGMRQRVGFARALVVEPTLLLMDEPFSALDVLTAETLRTDFLDLWLEAQTPIQGVLMVTHNIEEAVFMCDRVVVLAANPGRVQAEIAIPLPHPRDRLSAGFRQIVEDIYALLTTRPAAIARPLGPPVAQHLRHVSTNVLAGLLETIAAAPYGGRADLPEVAEDAQLEVDELLPAAEVLQMLGFADLADGDIVLTPAGRDYAGIGTQERKRVFSEHLLSCVPLVAHIRGVLAARPNQQAPRVRFEAELEDHLSEQYARETLNAAIEWGRYAELFAYDDQSEWFSLEDVTA
ncbi:MAG TPA: nitrate/sulfonate/bicarbonate ABC transporter ATP-binding protein [Thiobacillaceae bacterium]|nr:nitrate/sulfonate/bicarbonate ABC transporter ATP-binding protein [Thiobacillaceae bacterium]